jgi:hypothetical protein
MSHRKDARRKPLTGVGSARLWHITHANVSEGDFPM